MNDDKKIFEYKLFHFLNRVPYELLEHIKTYIPLKTFFVVDKNFYLKEHHILEEMAKNKFESYVRYLIRRDMDFSFSIVLKNYHQKWLNFKNYEYKHMIFINYLYFLQYYCIENDSSKCRIKLNIIFDETGLSKNQHKKNIIKYIKI